MSGFTNGKGKNKNLKLFICETFENLAKPGHFENFPLIDFVLLPGSKTQVTCFQMKNNMRKK